MPRSHFTSNLLGLISKSQEQTRSYDLYCTVLNILQSIKDADIYCITEKYHKSSENITGDIDDMEQNDEDLLVLYIPCRKAAIPKNILMTLSENLLYS